MTINYMIDIMCLVLFRIFCNKSFIFLSYKYKPNQIRDIVITSKIEAIISALVLKWKTYKFKGTSTARDVTIHTIANTKYLFLLSFTINYSLITLKFCVLRSSWKRYHISNIAHSCNKQQKTFKT